MNQDIRQQLSAFIDGELERDQARFLIRRLQDDTELVGCWQRWQIAGECLKGAAPAPMRIDFVARIAGQLESDPTPGRGVAVAPGVLRWVGGFAVAASVALAALIAIRPDVTSPDGVARVDAPTLLPVSSPGSEVVPSPYREEDLRPALRTQTVALTDASPYAAAVRIDPRIESYLVRHNEASASQGQGFVSYVTLVTPLRERAATESAR